MCDEVHLPEVYPTSPSGTSKIPPATEPSSHTGAKECYSKNMAKRFTDAQHKAWLASLPRKLVTAKVIIKSTAGNILLVKPDYQEDWQFPGGGANALEEPKAAAVREVLEEIGLAIHADDLHIVGTVFRKDYDNIILVYEYAKSLDERTIFTLQADEIEAYIFANPSKISSYLSDYDQSFWREYLQHS